ncbi:unnamed protein product [Toxocara canis]|uniref:eIF-4F 25 kDa subunit n=1 Tax=Toxocara canis TaxID=6265 RepID=A0A183UTD5_TOXCA|nr:unnamed protein product [Toxocara canis]
MYLCVPNSDPEDSVPLPYIAPHHFLQCRWALWYFKADRGRDWEDCLSQIAVFGTIEKFWALYNHIKPVSELSWGSDYYLFKEGIKPMWEDDSNINGGRWLVPVDKQRRVPLLDHYWLELLMAVIGEQFEDYADLICGAAVSVRQKGDKVSLWTRDSLRDGANLRIGQIVKAKLGIPDAEPIRYEVHKVDPIKSLSRPRFITPFFCLMRCTYFDRRVVLSRSRGFVGTYGLDDQAKDRNSGKGKMGQAGLI